MKAGSSNNTSEGASASAVEEVPKVVTKSQEEIAKKVEEKNKKNKEVEDPDAVNQAQDEDQAGPSNLQRTNEITTDQLVVTIRNLADEIVEFDAILLSFVNEQKKLAKKLLDNVIRYNILDSGPLHEFHIVSKEELLGELLSTIDEQTSKIGQELIKIKDIFDKLPKLNMILQQESSKMDWNPVTNPQVKGTFRYKAPSECLEAIADILYQYDVVITCMFHYFNALNVHDKDSYENLVNSIGISRELSTFANEFKINALMFK